MRSGLEAVTDMNSIISTLKNSLSEIKKLEKKLEVEISAIYSYRHNYRMSRNYLIQPQVELNSRIAVRVIKDKKTGVAITNSLLKEDIVRTGNRAIDVLKMDAPRENAGLPDKKATSHKTFLPEDGFFNTSKNLGTVHDWFLKAEDVKSLLSGSFLKEVSSFTVVNSRGIEQYLARPLISITFITEKESTSGYGSYLSSSYEPAMVNQQLERAISKSAFESEPLTIEPGSYTVLLEPEAFAEFVDLFSLFSFGAKHYLEKRSFVSDKLEKKMFPQKVTLIDNAKEKEQIFQPFDFEGVPRKKVKLIDSGKIAGVVYDTETARLAGKSSTGHSLPLPNPHGPVPVHLCFKAGNINYQELISSVDRGILVTRFNYTNLEEQKNGVITGMTRDGTFLIENGEIVAPVVDFRFTESAIQALKNLRETANDRRLVNPFFSSCLFPSVVIDSFNFTSIKEK